MAVLKNPRHESFAQAIAKGKTQDEAYQIAGYKPSRSAASRLSTNVNIVARVAELVSRGAEKAEITVSQVLQELGRVGFSDLRRVFDENGRLLRPEEWDDDTAAAIASVEVVTRSIGDGEVEHVHKIKTWDKNSALEKIGRHLGMFKERVEHSAEGSLLDLIRASMAKPKAE